LEHRRAKKRREIIVIVKQENECEKDGKDRRQTEREKN
jgi:hypothetical protein